ncbi:MAG: hypothetical protein CL980_00115 [Euryarchaeota archaeon]|nr:hypothetical protein [Euryarchaeota archaeon]
MHSMVSPCNKCSSLCNKCINNLLSIDSLVIQARLAANSGRPPRMVHKETTGGLVDTMKLRVVLLALVVLFPGCLEDTQEESSQPGESDYAENGRYTNISMEIIHGENVENATAQYTIRIMLNHSAAPMHADNMLKHVTAGNYNMTHYHRIIDDFMVQGGDFEKNDGSGGYAADWYGYCNGQAMANASNCANNEWTVPDEADNGLQHRSCMISMAKTSQPNTAGSQFFLMPDDIDHHAWLDGVHTVFGEITDGCEHVTTISEVETDSDDRPVVPVIITSATVVE